MDIGKNEVILQETESMTEEISNLIYQANIDALQNTLDQYGINKREYSLISPIKDDSVCLIYRGGQWSTFTLERGKEYSLANYHNINDAIFDVMRTLSDSDEEFEKMREYYFCLLDRLKNDQVPVDQLYQMIKERLEKFATSVAVF